jgi:histidinol-phosphatase (PHP family)
VSTAGLRKPVAEIYPAPAFLEMCVEAGRPVALSSDAHTPEQLGYEYERALELLDGLGVERIVVFDRRAQRLEPVG